jgi:hemoglobin
MQIEEPIFSPEHTPYIALGGDAKVREIVDTFYDTMDLEPTYARLREVHPGPLDGARDKLYWFLSGWLGGPQLYQEKFGHPRLKMRHMPFHIASVERDQWMACMGDALNTCGVDAAIKAWLLKQLFGTADWMRNQPDPA